MTKPRAVVTPGRKTRRGARVSAVRILAVVTTPPMTERDKMLAGALYDPLDAEVTAARERARDLCQALNASRESESARRGVLLVDLLGAGGDTAWIQPPFFCDYGTELARAALGAPPLLAALRDARRDATGERTRAAAGHAAPLAARWSTRQLDRVHHVSPVLAARTRRRGRVGVRPALTSRVVG